MSFLQLFLMINLFFLGIVVTVAARHGYAHFHPHPEEKPHPVEQGIRIPLVMREQLLEQATKKFQTVIDSSVTDLQHELSSTALELNKHLEKLGTAIVTDEMERFKILLEELKKKTEDVVIGGQTALAEHQKTIDAHLEERQKELETKMSEEIAAEKQQLLTQIDTKLSDAVASFLMETLQHNIDLGAQSEYLTAMLEEHKGDFSKRVTDEA